MTNPFKFDKRILNVYKTSTVIGGAVSNSNKICDCAITSATKPCTPPDTTKDTGVNKPCDP